MSARTDEEKRAVAHIKGKSPRNVERRSSVIRAIRESKERYRRAWLETEGVREALNVKQAIFDDFYDVKAHKELNSTPNNLGKPDAKDCDWCPTFRAVDCKSCPNCGKPLKKR